MVLPDLLYKELISQSSKAGWVVALSGGADSTALLVAIAAIKSKLNSHVRAIHINHQLQEQSTAWVLHCKELCSKHHIDYVSIQVDVPRNNGKSLESSAREVRYKAIAQELKPGEILLTAHHQDDQAETVLINLFRGSGLSGLSGIPKSRKLGNNSIFRPLLDVPQSTLISYLTSQKQHWIEDPMNQDTHHQRSFLRHELIPQIEQRWPAVKQKIAHASAHILEAENSISARISTIFATIRNVQGQALWIPDILLQTKSTQAQLLRFWIEKSKRYALSQAQIKEVLKWLKSEQTSKSAQLNVSHSSIYRFNNWLVLAPAMQQKNLDSEVSQYKKWNTDQIFDLENGNCLEWKHPTEIILEIRPRSGQERIKISSDKHHRSLKYLFQKNGIPPWVRNKTPLIFFEGQLVAIGDMFIDKEFSEKFPQAIYWQFDSIKSLPEYPL